MKRGFHIKNVLNISKHDSIGRRFNNLDMRDGFLDFGWQAQFCCWSEKTESDQVVQQAHGKLNRYTTKFLAKLGRFTGNVNGYYSNARAIKNLSFYEQADLLHFHIVHDEYLSIQDWLSLSKNKPVVWTWHDPYMLNGHCIHSLGCTGFETGCLTCPHLDYHFRVFRDRSKKNLAEKLQAVRQIDPLVIVASQYMQDLINRSVYGDFLRTKLLPFGVDVPAIESHENAKSKLKIPPENIVVGFRAVHSVYKGIPLIQAALTDFSNKYPNFPLTIITFQEKNFCDTLSSAYQIIDLGWISDRSIGDYYAAMDFFLMPSKAEAFGMMAIEAMAAGACPIVTYGTALPEVVSSQLSICVEHSFEAFSKAFEGAVLQAQIFAKQRIERIEYVSEKYNSEAFCFNLAAIYNEEYDYYFSNKFFYDSKYI